MLSGPGRSLRPSAMGARKYPLTSMCQGPGTGAGCFTSVAVVTGGCGGCAVGGCGGGAVGSAAGDCSSDGASSAGSCARRGNGHEAGQQHQGRL